MLTNFVSSADQIYQRDFSKEAFLKRSTKGAISSSFRRALST